MRISLLIIFAFLLPAAAQARPFPPGLEHGFLALSDGDLPGGCVLDATKVNSFAVDMDIRCGSDKATLRLIDVDDADSNGELKRTLSFSIRKPAPASATLEAAEKALAERISSRDDGAVHVTMQRASWEKNGDKSSSWVSALKLGLLDDFRRTISWIALLILLCWLIYNRRRSIGVGWLSLAIFALALGMRIKFGSWAPLHANSHGIAELRGLAGGPSDWQGPIETDRYGVAYRQVVRAFSLWHGHVTFALAFGAIAGALSVFPLWSLTLLFTDSVACAALAAFGIAMEPIHILLSPSESPMPLAGTLFLIGTAVLCRAGSFETVRLRTVAYWIGALALGCSGELAITTLAFTAAGILIAAIHLRPNSRRDVKLWMWPALILAITVLTHVYALWPVLTDAAGGRDDLWGTVRNLDGVRRTIAHFRLESMMLWPLAIIGAVVAMRKQGVAGVALVLAAAGVLAVSTAVNACETDIIRYQATAHLLLFVLVAEIPLIWSRPLFRWFAVAGIVWSLIPSDDGWTNFDHPLFDIDAYRYAKLSAEKAPNRMDVRIAPRRMADGQVLNDFPEFAFQTADRTVTVAEGPAQNADESCFVWLGPSCFSFTKKELAANVPSRSPIFDTAPMRAECKPVADTINYRGGMLSHGMLLTKFPEREFHWVEQNATVGMYSCRPAVPDEGGLQSTDPSE